MNRGLAYGDGFFETMFCKNAEVPLFLQHHQRLLRSLSILGMDMTPELEAECIQKHIKYQWPEGTYRIRLSIYREKGFGYTPTSQKPILQWYSEPYIHDVRYSGIQSMVENLDIEALKSLLLSLPLRTCGLSSFRNYADSRQLSSVKSLSSLHYVMAAQEANDQSWDDALLLDDKGNVSECIQSNLFWIMGSNIYTPDLQNACVAGVARARLLLQNHLNIHEITDIDPGLLTDECVIVFSTNALRGFSRLKVIA